MKNIKTFDSFFSNIFSSEKKHGKWFWSNTDEIELEELGFRRGGFDAASSLGTFRYIPHFNEKLKEISIDKWASEKDTKRHSEFFYEVTVKTNKQIIKDFETIQEVVGFVKQYIPEIDTDTKKYNL